jgi:hypothetical protein
MLLYFGTMEGEERTLKRKNIICAAKSDKYLCIILCSCVYEL